MTCTANSLIRNSPIRIEGGNPLCGRVHIQGSKNATLPILAATLMIPGKSIIYNAPDITDIYYMTKLLECSGCVVTKNENCIMVDASDVKEYRFPGTFVKKMRSSVILLGAMLGRLGEAGIDYPGGCVIGERPIDIHLMALRKLGADIQIEGNYIHAMAKELVGTDIVFPFPSVGATQNVILAAVNAKGTTKIHNAALEPEVTELCRFLNKSGADIEVVNNDTIVINETSQLAETEYKVCSDRIVAGTYLFAAMATKGEIILEEAPIDQMSETLKVVKSMGGMIDENLEEHKLTLNVPRHITNLDYIETAVYPGFPTDLQSPLLVAACKAEGMLVLRETIFNSRFKVIEELKRMGADIYCCDDTAVINGASKLTGRNVIARELRGGAALVIAGLAAGGITIVSESAYIERGYEDIVRDLSLLGAKLQWII